MHRTVLSLMFGILFLALFAITSESRLDSADGSSRATGSSGSSGSSYSGSSGESSDEAYLRRKKKREEEEEKKKEEEERKKEEAAAEKAAQEEEEAAESEEHPTGEASGSTKTGGDPNASGTVETEPPPAAGNPITILYECPKCKFMSDQSCFCPKCKIQLVAPGN